MLNKKRAYEIIELIVANTDKYVTVEISEREEGLTRFANSEIHQNVYNLDCVLKINLFEGKKISLVSTNVLDDNSILDALKAAENKLKFLPEGTIQLPELQNLEEIYLDDYSLELNEEFNIRKRASLLKESIDMLDKEFIAAGAFSLTNKVIVWGNSNNVRRFASNSSVKLNAMIMHDDGASGYIQTSVSKASELNVLDQFTMAYNKAKMGLEPRSIEPGKYDVILEPLAAGNLVTFFSYIGANAKLHQNGMSCFTGEVGNQVMGDNITIKDDLNHPCTSGMPFDFEGYERKALSLIDKGVLKSLAYDTITAIEDNTETTGHSVGYAGRGGIPLNIVVDAGNSSIDEMIKSTKKGLLVCRFHYMNVVNPRQGLLTALTRDGLYLVEDGQIKYPVHNLRFTDSISNIFNNVESLTKDRRKTPSFFGTSYVPGMKVKNFSFTGKTEL